MKIKMFGNKIIINNITVLKLFQLRNELIIKPFIVNVENKYYWVIDIPLIDKFFAWK
jgi:hypothetical protein